MGSMEDIGWRWELTWRRNFFLREVSSYHEFLAVIGGFQLIDREDSWRWRSDPDEGYTAKSAYQIRISRHRHGNQPNQLQQFVFNNIWKSAAPSKVIAFSWQLMLDRIPTKQNLALRGVQTGNDMMCMFCNMKVETSVHLFLHCDFAAKIWYKITRWIGQELLLPPSLGHSFSLLIGCGAGKR
ncbi:putative ribonuclease H protein, partial [Trifolium medium]|nr:putative ribonuclease H protein [Trifolium medium]